ncbi:MAG: hypothetical protein CMF42_03075 [Legionellales bacterium]|nr:hypothetical protein [Legionellales bacterium]OUX67753.1 MAG: hypothetical protein CBD38_01940 [bacterium TMED178]|tara:strand:- start:6060 stop:7166 length:1107 start_codon:yes stop_codon:yes gene_type:complete
MFKKAVTSLLLFNLTSEGVAAFSPDLDIGGTTKIGLEYNVVPTKWASNPQYQDGFDIISNSSNFHIGASQALDQDSTAYFKYVLRIDTAMGTMNKSTQVKSGTNYAYVGYTYKNFDIQTGAMKSIPYKYVGKYDDVAFIEGYHSYSANRKIQKAVLATYQIGALQLGTDIQATATGVADGQQGDQGTSSIFSYAVGAQYAKDNVEIGVAYNAYTSGAVGNSNTSQSEQLQSLNNSGQIPPYWGIGGAYTFDKATGNKLFGQFSYLSRGNNSNQHGTNSSLSNGDNVGYYQDSSYDIGIKLYNTILRYSSGYLDSESNSLLVNHQTEVAKNLFLRTEVNFPSVLAVDSFNSRHRTIAINSYAVDVKYVF